MLTATLYINEETSRCGGCGKGADPVEKQHTTHLKWTIEPYEPTGCDATFIAVDTDSVRTPALIEAIREMRPGLPLVGQN
jgi:hypothetical protein